MDHLFESQPSHSRALLFLKEIKLVTRPAHELLETSPLLSSLLQDDLQQRQYCCYLQLMLQVEQAYEQQVLPKLTGVMGLPESDPASSNILQDLVVLGTHCLAGKSVPAFSIPDSLLTIPFAFGFMYVMKGSKLGGKVIYRQIHRKLGFTGTAGAKYITDNGHDTLHSWKRFLELFADFVVVNECEAGAIAGANFAFSSIHDYFLANHHLYEF